MLHLFPSVVTSGLITAQYARKFDINIADQLYLDFSSFMCSRVCMYLVTYHFITRIHLYNHHHGQGVALSIITRLPSH